MFFFRRNLFKTPPVNGGDIVVFSLVADNNDDGGDDAITKFYVPKEVKILSKIRKSKSSHISTFTFKTAKNTQIITGASAELRTIVARSADTRYFHQPTAASSDSLVALEKKDDHQQPASQQQQQQQVHITLKRSEVKPRVFHDFLLALAHERFGPTPENVVELTALAHLYGVKYVLADCERHLLTCEEHSRVRRLYLADKFDLAALKVRVEI